MNKYNIERKKSIFKICIYSVLYKNISSLFGKVFLPEKHGLIIAFFLFFHCNIELYNFPISSFFPLFSLFS